MKPSDRCKAAGLRSLKELSEITGKTVQTLINWNREKPELFELVLIGAVNKKKTE